MPDTADPAPTGFRLRLLATDPAGSGDGAISPDGTRFVASSRRSGSVNLWFFDLRTGCWQQGTRGDGEDIEAQWSPDGQKLAFTSTRTGTKSIWLYRLADGQVRQLTGADHEEEYPSWSPDGSTIAFAGGRWGNRHFYTVDAAGGPAVPVTARPGRAGACSWAPDGRWLICHSYDTGSGAIFLLDVAGRDQIPVTDGVAWDYKPTICPVRPVAAFSRSNEGRSVIWVQRLGDGAGHPLVTTGGDDRWPSWTADGQHLFFHRLVDEGVGIFVWDRDTRQVTQVVPAAENPRFASFDPAGERVVYSATIDGRSRLRTRDLDTGATTDLEVGEAAFPAWSPDGTRVAFVTRPVPGGRWEIATADHTGADVRVWTAEHPGLRGLHAPLDWSPDGTRLLFKTETEPFEANLCVLDLRDGTIRTLLDDNWWDEAPTWTPDGAGVTFMSTRGGEWTWGLFHLDLASGAITTLAGPDYIEKNNPRRTPGDRLVWTVVAAGTQELYEQLPDGTGRVVDEAGTGVRYPVCSADGRRIVFTRTTSTVQYWLAENVWADDSPVAHLARPLIAATSTPAVAEQPPAGPVRSPVDTRRR